jgi:hypothetical protein
MSASAFHEKAGQCQVGSFWLWFASYYSQPLRRCRHPSIRTLGERWNRSVQVGCSRFSRCCHLIIDLPPIARWKLGQAFVAVTGTRRWGFMLLSILSELRSCRQLDVVALA